jgi:hypothetical protein
MNVNNDRLTKEELQYLIEELSLLDDNPAEETASPEESTILATLQSGLKKRLQRSIEEMRERNEEVPVNLLDLVERL